MIVSSEVTKIMFSGSKVRTYAHEASVSANNRFQDGAEIVELSSNGFSNNKCLDLSATSDYTLWGRTRSGHELSSPEGSVTFEGDQDQLIIGYSSSETHPTLRFYFSFFLPK